MYPSLQEIETTDIHGFVHNKQRAFQRAFELVLLNLNEKQKRRNAIYNKKGPRSNKQRITKSLALSSRYRCWIDF